MNRRIVTIAVGLTAAGLLAGCGGSGGGDKPSVFSSSAKSGDSKNGDSKSDKAAAPIITAAQAAKVLDAYQTVNNAANKTQDGAKLGAVEDGALFQQSSAQYKQFPEFTAKTKAAYTQPFLYGGRQFYIPATGSWFMVSASPAGGNYPKDEHQLIVFKRQSGGNWKMVVADNYTGTLPALAKGPDGAPAAAASDTAVRRATVKEYTTRNDDWGKYKGCLRTDYEDAGTKWDSAYIKYPDTYALKTADGGALVAGTSYYVELDFSTRPDQCSVVPGGTTTAYLHGDQTGVRNRYASLNVISVPAAGKPAQLGGDVQLIGASS